MTEPFRKPIDPRTVVCPNAAHILHGHSKSCTCNGSGEVPLRPERGFVEIVRRRLPQGCGYWIALQDEEQLGAGDTPDDAYQAAQLAWLGAHGIEVWKSTGPTKGWLRSPVPATQQLVTYPTPASAIASAFEAMDEETP